ncbi:MAG: hypothetical protein WCK35_26860, partial [Chloroflexota bacterium]
VAAGVAHVYSIFVFKDDKAAHNFTGMLGFTPNSYVGQACALRRKTFHHEGHEGTRRKGFFIFLCGVGSGASPRSIVSSFQEGLGPGAFRPGGPQS